MNNTPDSSADRGRNASAWTLFLDRDGVINRQIRDGYVTSWEEFEFLPQSREALRVLASLFGSIFVITNQRGIALGRYSLADLDAIHRRMIDAVERDGGRIDGVYVCPHGDGDLCDCRKPRPGLIRRAMSEHPSVDVTRSIIVGDSQREVELGRALGIVTVSIGSRALGADHAFASLYDFAQGAGRVLDQARLAGQQGSHMGPKQ